MPEFDELSVKNLWAKWKENEFILQYIPNYPASQLPEKDFLFGVVGTLYPDEIRKSVDKAFQNRHLHYNKEESEQIEITMIQSRF